jgi:hypothetical protein
VPNWLILSGKNAGDVGVWWRSEAIGQKYGDIPALKAKMKKLPERWEAYGNLYFWKLRHPGKLGLRMFFSSL